MVISRRRRMKGFFKKYKKLLFIFAILVVSLGGGYYYYQSRFTFYVPELVIKDYELIGDDDAVVIDWRLKGKENELVSNVKSKNGEIGGATHVSFGIPLVIGTYATTQSIKLTERPDAITFNRNEPKFGEYWYITVYDLKASIPTSKQYNLFKLVREFDDSYAPVLSGYYSKGIEINGKFYQKIFLRSVTNSEDRKMVLLDIEEGRLVEESEELDFDKLLNIGIKTNLYDYFEDFLTIGVTNDRSLILSKAGISASNSWQLKKENGKALELWQSDHSRLYILENTDDAEALFETWQLLLPEGSDIFDNLILSSAFSKDGQEHKITSVADFQNFYNGK